MSTAVTSPDHFVPSGIHQSEVAGVGYESPYADVVKTWTISLAVFAVVLLGTIGLWLWHGTHLYQNCSLN